MNGFACAFTASCCLLSPIDRLAPPCRVVELSGKEKQVYDILRTSASKQFRALMKSDGGVVRIFVFAAALSVAGFLFSQYFVVNGVGFLVICITF